MGVATGCGCKEVYRFPHTTYPYSSCTHESWHAIKDLKAPFPDLKAGHVKHLLTCIFF